MSVTFSEFVKQYRPLSQPRTEAVAILRKIKELPDLPSWEHIAAGLGPGVVGTHRKFCYDIYTFWRLKYLGSCRKTVVQPLTRVSEPAPMPEGSVRISSRHNPVEVEVDGSRVLIPLGVIAWVKAIDENNCIVSLLNGETLHVTNTPEEIRLQLCESDARS